MNKREDKANFQVLTVHSICQVILGETVRAAWGVEQCLMGLPRCIGNASWAGSGVDGGLERGERDPDCKWSKNWSED